MWVFPFARFRKDRWRKQTFVVGKQFGTCKEIFILQFCFMCSRKQASPKPRRNNRGNKCTWEMNLMAWLLALIQSLSSQLELSLGIDMCRVSAMQDGVFAITASLYVKPSNIAPLTSEKSFKDSLSGSVCPSLPLLTSPLTQKGTRQHICWHVHVRHTDTHTHRYTRTCVWTDCARFLHCASHWTVIIFHKGSLSEQAAN